MSHVPTVVAVLAGYVAASLVFAAGWGMCCRARDGVFRGLVPAERAVAPDRAVPRRGRLSRRHAFEHAGWI